MEHLQILIDKRWLSLSADKVIEEWEEKREIPVRIDLLQKIQTGSIVLCFARKPTRLVAFASIKSLKTSEPQEGTYLKKSIRYKIIPADVVLMDLHKINPPVLQYKSFSTISLDKINHFLLNLRDSLILSGPAWASYIERVSNYDPERRILEFSRELTQICDERREYKAKQKNQIANNLAQEILSDTIINNPNLKKIWDMDFKMQKDSEFSYGESLREDISRPTEFINIRYSSVETYDSMFGDDPLTKDPKEASAGALARFIDQRVIKPISWINKINMYVDKCELNQDLLIIKKNIKNQDDDFGENNVFSYTEDFLSFKKLFNSLSSNVLDEVKRLQILLSKVIKETKLDNDNDPRIS